MYAAASGKSTLGIPQSVGLSFIKHANRPVPVKQVLHKLLMRKSRAPAAMHLAK